MNDATGPLVIAIDGPAAAGKGTLARRLAEAYGLPHLDTGLLYRATARVLLDGAGGGAGDPAPEAAARAAASLRRVDLGRDDLRTPEVDRFASLVAAMAPVRAALLEWQRRFAADGAVLDGRDIGTVVCPDAPVKLFVTASPAVRAARRLRERGEAVDEAALAAEAARIAARDQADRARDASPLRPAADAAMLDTTALDADAAFAAACGVITERLGRLRSGLCPEPRQEPVAPGPPRGLGPGPQRGAGRRPAS